MFALGYVRPLRSVMRLVTKRDLNRIIFRREEVCNSEGNVTFVSIPDTDNRAQHIKKILKLQAGDSIRTGIVDIGISNISKVTSMEDGVTIEIGPRSSIHRPPVPAVDLLLAVPRPHKLEKILPVISCLGVRNVYLVGAKKVESGYFGSHLLTSTEKVTNLLIEGLSQAEVDCNLPKVTVFRHLRDFFAAQGQDTVSTCAYKVVAHPPLQAYNAHKTNRTRSQQTDSITANHDAIINTNVTVNELKEDQYQNQDYARIHQHVMSNDSLRFSEYIAQLIDAATAIRGLHGDHNTNSMCSSVMTHISGSDINSSTSALASATGMLVAVGPEGGWTEEEVDQLQHRGFQLVNLGPRILRTDIAVPILLGLAHDFNHTLSKM